MANSDSTQSQLAIPEVLENLVARAVESYLNGVLQEQMTEHLGANRSERNEERTGYRNGVRERQLYTRVGVLHGYFSTLSA